VVINFHQPARVSFIQLLLKVSTSPIVVCYINIAINIADYYWGSRYSENWTFGSSLI
jgi:hypothetical protein